MDLSAFFSTGMQFVQSNIVAMLIVLVPFGILVWLRPRLVLKGAVAGAVLVGLVYVVSLFFDVTRTGVSHKETIVEKSESLE